MAANKQPGFNYIAAMAGDGGLAIRGLSKRYGDIQAVDDISLDVPRGSLIGFLGPNGAGKTTTMRSIVGMVRPDSGTISWDGVLVDDSVRTKTGYMPQERGLYPRMKVREQVVYFGRLAQMSSAAAGERADYWLERLDLTARADSFVQDLSGGNQQRVQLAVSLVHQPELLVLDEPFAGLDPIAAETMRSIIAERAEEGASVLFSSHQLDLVEGLCKQVVIVADGRRIASGQIADLRAASPRRRLSVRWAEPVEWTPAVGEVLEQGEAHAVLDMPSDADSGELLASVASVGQVVEVSLEPPGLDEVFVDMVAGVGARSETEVLS